MATLLVNGCSFTETLKRQDRWCSVLAQQLSRSLTNLARVGAGNLYICRSTVNWIERVRPDPSSVLVIVMWSGTARIDVPVSKSWYQHINSTFYYATSDYTSNWIHTGSSGHVAVLENLCKTNDNLSLCVESLQNFVLLGNYLKAKGFRYIFTSYANYWDKNNEYCPTTQVDPCIGYHCASLPLYQNFDFSNWFFVNQNKDCFGEYAINDITHSDDAHPTEPTHQRFALDVMLPGIEQVHMQCYQRSITHGM